MSTRSADYKEAVDHLPEGAMLVLQGVTWEDYEQFPEDLIDQPRVRVGSERRTTMLDHLEKEARCEGH